MVWVPAKGGDAPAEPFPVSLFQRSLSSNKRTPESLDLSSCPAKDTQNKPNQLDDAGTMPFQSGTNHPSLPFVDFWQAF